MPDVITSVEDLRLLAKRRVPKMFYDYADSGAWTESTYRANETDFARIKLRQRVAVDMTNRSLASTMIGQPVAMPVALAPTGLTGMQHADGEILAAQRGREGGRAVHAVDDEHLLDRGRRRARDEAVLVPALRDEGSRLHRSADRSREGRGLQRADADARPADPRPAAQGREERPDRAAEADAREPARPRDEAALVPRHARHEAPHVPQHRRPRAEREGRQLAVVVDRGAVRPEAVVGRRASGSATAGAAS